MGLEVEDRQRAYIALTQTPGTTSGADAPEVKSAIHRIDEVVRFEHSALWEEVHMAAQIYRTPHHAVLPAHTAEGQTCADAANRIDAVIADVQATLHGIGDRQRILIGARVVLERQALPAVRELIDAARESTALAELAGTPEARARRWRDASTRLQAAEILAQLAKIESAYIGVADYADDHGLPSGNTVAILGAMNQELQPIRDAALSLDPEKTQAALLTNRGALEHAAEFLPKFATRLEAGWKTSRKVIAAIDSAMIVLSAYQGARAVGQGLARGTGGPGVGGFAGGGAAAMGVSVLVTAEMVESIRKLVQIGALANVIVSGGAPHLAETSERPPRRRAGLTSPSREASAIAEPRGRPAKIRPADDEVTRRSHRRENEAAQALARMGYEVEQTPAVAGNKRPDLRIEGAIFDVYAPKYRTSASNIFETVREKVEKEQARRIVINLDESPVRVPRLAQEFAQRRGEVRALDEVLAVRKGHVTRIYP